MQKQHLWVFILFQTHIVFVLSICGTNEFTCNSGKCIATSRLCDEYFDCDGSTGEDELSENCQRRCQTKCPEGQYQCDDCRCVGNKSLCITQETTTDEASGNSSKTVIVLCITALVVVVIVVCGVIFYKKKRSRIHPKLDQNENTNDHQRQEQRPDTNQLTLQERDTLPERRGNRRLPPIQNLSTNRPVNTLYPADTQLSMNRISVHASLDSDREL